MDRGSRDGHDVGERSGRPARTVWVAGGVLLGGGLALLTVGVLRSGGGASEPAVPIAEPPAEVAVLLPRVTVLEEAPAFSSASFAAAVHEEVMARLSSIVGAEIVSVPFESEVAQLVRSLEAQGAIDPAQGRVFPPEWVVSISVRAGGGQARVIGLLLRGPDYTDAAAVSAHDYSVPSGADALLKLPRRIAAEMVKEFGRVLGEAEG